MKLFPKLTVTPLSHSSFYVLFFIGCFYSQSGFATDDWGSSHNLLLKADLSEDWIVLSRSNVAIRNDNEQMFLYYSGASLGYQVNNQWSARAGLRYVRFRIADEWRTEERPMVELYYANRYQNWRLTSRSRVEFRDPNWRQSDIRFRQEFTMTAPWKFSSLGLSPFVEEEIFYSKRNGWIEANWATFGLSAFLAKGVKVKLAYRHNRFRLFGDINTRHTMVTGLNIFF